MLPIVATGKFTYHTVETILIPWYKSYEVGTHKMNIITSPVPNWEIWQILDIFHSKRKYKNYVPTNDIRQWRAMH
jgi:hypothetical protein